MAGVPAVWESHSFPLGTAFLSQPADSFPAMSCVPIDGELRQLLNRFSVGTVPADEIPTDLLDQLREWGWVMGRERLELTGIGMYHAGEPPGGILGG